MKPQQTIKGITLFPVPEFSDLDIAFGSPNACYFNRRDLPYVPDKFETMASELFFNGGNLPKFSKHIDLEKARRAVIALLGSFEPPHESKIATVAYALWLWTNDDALTG